VELRQYVDILRRRTWFILETVLVVAIAAGVMASLRTPTYQATARILLRPDDPSEQLNPTERVYRDPNRYVQAQKDIIRSEAVAQEAVAALQGVSVRQIERQVSVSEGDQSDVLKISASSTDATQARDVANAVANGYIENRRKSAVVGLERAAKELQDKLGPLQAAIAELDVRIGALGAPPAEGTDVTAPERPVEPPSGPITGLDPAITAGGVPANSEALKAARYAAAVQFETLFARQQELLVDISLKRGEAELIAEAKTPTEPVSPRPKRDLAVGAFVGLLLGAGVTLLRDQFDDRMHSVADVEQATGLPVLAQLPYDEEAVANPNEIAAIRRPQSSLSEAARSLRTSIQYLGVDRPIKVIVVTSAVPGEGKSVVSANLAAVCAQAGHRTMLVAADLRRLGVSRFFGVSASSPGLTNVVAQVAGNGVARGAGNGQKEPAFASAAAGAAAGSGGGSTTIQTVSGVVTRPMANLAFVPAGPTPPNPAELLGSRRMRQVLAEIAEHTDVVVIDTPPLLPVTDAAVLASQADGVVLVTAIGETRRDAVQRAKAILDGTSARVLGVVVNKAPKSTSAYYYGGYYSEGGSSSEGSGRRGLLGRLRGRKKGKGRKPARKDRPRSEK
jgi:Mrp family chromosome partitioning ATPase/capsular polysaccharide biosynthesis protein